MSSVVHVIAMVHGFVIEYGMVNGRGKSEEGDEEDKDKVTSSSAKPNQNQGTLSRY